MIRFTHRCYKSVSVGALDLSAIHLTRSHLLYYLHLSITEANLTSPNMAAPAELPARYTVAATEKRPEILEAARKLKDTPWCEEYEKMISGML